MATGACKVDCLSDVHCAHGSLDKPDIAHGQTKELIQSRGSRHSEVIFEDTNVRVRRKQMSHRNALKL